MTQYDVFAKKINDNLKRGKVTIVDTTGLDSFCDNTSLSLDNQVKSLIYDEKDNDTIKLVFDTLIKHGGNEYYIEPYNCNLLNVTKL